MGGRWVGTQRLGRGGIDFPFAGVYFQEEANEQTIKEVLDAQ
ncbi:MAG: hypothetical protein WBG01_12730 [Bacteroidota bacterium]